MRHFLSKEFLIILLLYFLVFISILVISFSDYTFSYKIYLGIISLIITSVLYFLNKKVYKIGLGIILVLGVINFIEFFFLSLGFSFGIIDVISISINPLILILLIAYYFIFKDFVLTVIGPSTKEKIKMEKANEKNQEILDEHYKEVYALKSTSELEKILIDTKYTIEAKKAAKDILKERG